MYVRFDLIFVLTSLVLTLSGIVPAQPSPRLLEIGKAVEGSLAGGQTDSLLLQMNAGQYVYLTVDQLGIDVVVTLFAPDGRKLMEVDSPNGTEGPEPLWQIAAVPGVYRLEVRSLENDAKPGKYKAKIVALRPGSEKDSLIVSAKTADRVAAALEAQGDKESKEKAIAKLTEAVNFYKQAGDTLEQAKQLGRLGDGFLAKGDYSMALETFRIALKLFENIGDQEGVAISLNRIGRSYEQLVDFSSAFEWYRKALTISEKSGLRSLTGMTLNDIGLLHRKLGENDQALESYRKLLAMALQDKAKDRIGLALNNIGVVLVFQGRYIEALDYFQRELALGAEFSARTDMNIGLIYNRQGNLPQALAHYQRALKQFEAWGATGSVALVLTNIGNVYLSMDDYASALGYFQRALALSGDDVNIFSNLGVVYGLTGDKAKSTEYFQKSLRLAEYLREPLATAAVLVATGSFYYSQGNFLEAVEYEQRATKLAKKIDALSILSQSLDTEGWSHIAMNQPEEARKAFNEAISTVEFLRSHVTGDEGAHEKYFGINTSPYYGMVNVLINENKLAEALEYSERSKSRALLDVLKAQGRDMDKALTVEQQAQLRGFKLEISSLNAQLAKARREVKVDEGRLSVLQSQLDKKRLEFEDVQTRIYRAHPGSQVQQGDMKAITVEDAAALLGDENSAALEFVVTESRTFLFSITKDASRQTDVKVSSIGVKNRDLVAKIETYRSKLASGDINFYEQSHELYDLLMKPALAHIAGKTNVIIVPDGPLWNLPFQALIDEKGKYVAEKIAVSYAPSLTALKEMKKKAVTRRSPVGSELLAFGNPIPARETTERVRRVFMNEKMEPLPEAERLVNELGRMYGPKRSKVFTGINAREETAKNEASKYRIVQFATHGILNNASPMYSHLVLAQDEKNPNEDGLLEAWELKDLNLKADIVILSACDTARGKISSGEGVIGMTWAAFIAGAPATVASQWKVESSSTTELMLEFHRQLLSKSHPSKAEALRRASLKLLRSAKYSHPSFWAGWVLVGDGS